MRGHVAGLRALFQMRCSEFHPVQINFSLRQLIGRLNVRRIFVTHEPIK